MLRIQTGARIASSASRRAKRLAAPSLVAHFSTSGSQSNVLQQIAEERQSESYEPFRKQYKDEQRKRRLEGIHKKSSTEISESTIANWELTVGLEVHAQLNTDHKLFSRAGTTSTGHANHNAALFDLALPGSQPMFNQAVLLPALRAALALQCRISLESRFDRKHYFYQDQPAGYQITQYYEPFARDGYLILDSFDDIPTDHGEEVRVGIKQIQLEQDTAKTVQRPPHDILLDFNRVGHPLIEIITLPHIHNARTAAACVKKIQSILQSVNAVTTGMELGGLRADVNVSVRPKDAVEGIHSYHGVAGLGQRTEIKNLSSFKAVEDAIIAERNRQISVLERGGEIEGETRGWSLGSTETRKLRGKEGEVDYRYMPDPDIAPLCIQEGLVEHIRNGLPMLPESLVSHLVDQYQLTTKDAKTIVKLDDGQRLDYLESTLAFMSQEPETQKVFGLLASNWILHELGGLLSAEDAPFESNPVEARTLATLLLALHAQKITTKSAKTLLAKVFEGDKRSVEEIIEQDELSLAQVDEEGLNRVATELVEQHPDMAMKVLQGQKGKFQWFVGQLIRQHNGRLDAKKATAALEPLLLPK